MLLTSLIAAVAFGPSITKDVVYSTVDSKELKADIYRPADSETKDLPFIIVIHGGSWMSGKKEDMASLAEAFAQAGMVAISINYRLAPASKYPAMIDDSRVALAFFRKNAAKYHLNASRVGSAGASAGGHLALLLGYTDSPADLENGKRVSAIFNLFGPVDLSQDFSAALGQLMSQQVLGVKFEESAASIKAMSPITYVDAHSSPTFTIHGDKDTLVPVRQATRLDEALKANHVQHVMEIVPGLGHQDPSPIPGGKEAVAKGIEFMHGHLVGNHH